MKVIVLSCNTGGGHNAAARAIKKEMTRHGIECDIKNALDFVPKAKQEFVEVGHTLAYKYAPHLYGEIFKRVANQKNHYFLYLDYAVYAGKLARYIKSNHYDTAISVHEFPAIMLTSARKMKQLDIRQYFVSTDYSFAPGLELTEMDGYFIPAGFGAVFSEKLCGKSIFETGIPVDSTFYEKGNREEIRKRLMIRDDVKLFILTAGSIGCGPIRILADKILDYGEKDAQVAVFCGNNRRLQRELALDNHEGRLLPLGFTGNVHSWIFAADLVISKAGGLSTTEAVTAGLPMILIDAVSGLEEMNLRYFVDGGFAATADTVDGICKVAAELVCSNEKQAAMIARQKEQFHENAVEKLCAQIISEV